MQCMFDTIWKTGYLLPEQKDKEAAVIERFLSYHGSRRGHVPGGSSAMCKINHRVWFAILLKETQRSSKLVCFSG